MICYSHISQEWEHTPYKLDILSNQIHVLLAVCKGVRTSDEETPRAKGSIWYVPRTRSPPQPDQVLGGREAERQTTQVLEDTVRPGVHHDEALPRSDQSQRTSPAVSGEQSLGTEEEGRDGWLSMNSTAGSICSQNRHARQKKDEVSRSQDKQED